MGFDELIEEFRPLHNDICISGHTALVRLVGLEEREDDYYFRVRALHGVAGRGEHLESCVGSLISLKGILPDTYYACMDQVFGWNGAEPSDEFIVRRLPADHVYGRPR